MRGSARTSPTERTVTVVKLPSRSGVLLARIGLDAPRFGDDWMDDPEYATSNWLQCPSYRAATRCRRASGGIVGLSDELF